MGEIAFPGSVMMLKLVSKLFIEREVSLMDAAKAIIAFPVDIMFLAFSFGAALLYNMPATTIPIGGLKLMLAVVVGSIVFSMLVTALCRKGDKAFDQKRYSVSVGWVFVTYILSLGSLFVSFGVRGIFR